MKWRPSFAEVERELVKLQEEVGVRECDALADKFAEYKTQTRTKDPSITNEDALRAMRRRTDKSALGEFVCTPSTWPSRGGSEGAASTTPW